MRKLMFGLLFCALCVVQGDCQTEATLELKNETTSEKTPDDEIFVNAKKNLNTVPLKTLNKFSELAHGVKSGNVTILNNHTIFIPNFHFDGNAPDAHFLMGHGNTVGEQNAVFVPLKGNTESVALSAFNGQDITLVLPQNLTVDQFDWLAFWCVIYELNMGSVALAEKPGLPFPPQIFDINNVVKSGPVVLVDKKTLFVPNLRYDGRYEDVHFWVGKGTEPTSEGLVVPDENGSLENLHSYQGQNVYIKLPGGTTTDDIDYFAVWSKGEKINLGHVIIGKTLEVPDSKLETTNEILRLPKCCPMYEVITPKGCQSAFAPRTDFRPDTKILQHNETHLETIPMDSSKFVFQPYYYALTCLIGKYSLNEKNENFSLLHNGSLIVKAVGIGGILAQGDFCMDYVEDESKLSIFVCAPEAKINHAMFQAYLILTITSTFCFAGAFILYLFILKFVDIHRKCFTCYSFSMCATFVCLVVIQVAYIENHGCAVIGFFFQFCMISSFTWLAILCYDVAFIIKYFEDNTNTGRRLTWYYGISFAVPTLSLFISLGRNLTPDVPNSFFKPQYGRNTCYFEAESQRLAYFYVPIAISLFVSLVCLIYSKYEIVLRNRKVKMNVNFFWAEKRENFAFMFRSFFIVFITMLLWLVEAIIHSVYANATILMAIDMVEAIQGIIILLLFVISKQAKNEIVRRLHKKKRKKGKSNGDADFEDDVMMEVY